jgi:hypothetical protein
VTRHRRLLVAGIATIIKASCVPSASATNEIDRGNDRAPNFAAACIPSCHPRYRDAWEAGIMIAFDAGHRLTRDQNTSLQTSLLGGAI